MKTARAQALREMADEHFDRALELVKGKPVPLDPKDPDVQLAAHYVRMADWLSKRKGDDE